ncbi:TolC family protein [Marivirga sp. S37H4]|uniref:TolC family protein n=1 Tax=Marivirga aurantiaca TaxID=2802615 RepID=A0A935CCL0_9BACT|nr:TolC family protein [Marivirga aurantiaca]MBK6266113.1 TolC family protein [Marivirga aurantiaca]
MVKNIFLIVLCLCATQLLGQDKWSLQQCIDYALEHNIQIKQSELDAQSADINLFGSRMRSLPDMNANVSFNTSKGRSIDPFTNTIIDQGINSQNASINASVPIFNGFEIRNSVKRDQKNLLASTYDLQSTQNDVILNVVTFYTNILFNMELLETAQLRLGTTQSQQNRVDKQVEIGALPMADLLQIRQQMANDELEVIRAENNLELSKLQLKQALQIPGDVEFEIEIPTLPEPEEEVLIENSSQVYLYALQNQPVIKAARARTESAMYGVGVARSNYFPSLSLNAALSTAYSSAAPDVFPVLGSENQVITQQIGFVQLPDDSQYPVFAEREVPSEFTENTYWNQLDFNQRQFVGLSLNIPIFNKFQVKNNVEQAILTQKNTEYQLINAKNQLQQTIEQAYLDVKSAAKAYSALENSLEAAQLSFDNAEQRLQLGATDAVEYTQIKNDYERVRSDLVRAKYDYIFKLKVLDFYQGKPLNF